MSGGAFDYKQHAITDIADTMEEELRHENMSEAAKGVFREIISHLRLANIMAHRADWFLSGDDSEESFLLRLKEELERFER